MFKKKFSEEMLNIKATDESKAKLLEKIEEEKSLSSLHIKKSAKKRWISSIAAAVAVVIVSVSVFNLPIFKGEDKVVETGSKGGKTSQIQVGDATVDFPVIEHKQGIPASVSHSEVYKLFSAIYQADRLHSVDTEGGIYDEWEEETVIEDSADDINTGVALKGESVNTNPPGGAGDTGKEDFSTTNTQVEDVDEADIVKTDGEYIYALNSRDGKVIIARAEQGKLSKVASFNLFEEKNIQDKKYYDKYYSATEMDMYLCGDRIIVIHEEFSKEKSSTIVKIYNISDPKNPTVVHTLSQSGNYLSSRVIAGKLYVFTNEYFYGNPDREEKSSYLPCTAIDDEGPKYVEAGCIYMFDGEVNRSYLTVSSVDVSEAKIIDTKTALGGGTTLYANTKNFYVTADASSVSYLTDNMGAGFDNKTRVMRFEIADGKITAMAEGSIEGTPLNQFSMDEHGGYFRIVTTGYNKNYNTVNSVYVLDKELKMVGSITDIAKGERVYSVRFMGNIGYFVTFRQVDPLFAVDLSNPKEPKILSALKIPGFSNYLHPWGEGLLLGIGADADEKTGRTGNVKLSMFDISNPENVTESNKFIAAEADSMVGTNHKSVLVSKERNLIAFPIKDEYFVFGYNPKSGFELKATLNAPPLSDMYYYSGSTRGIYIGDYLYVCNYNGIISYNLSDFSEVDSIIF